MESFPDPQPGAANDAEVGAPEPGSRDSQRAAQEWLEAKLLEGLASGPPEPMTAADWSRIRQTVRDRAKQRG